MTDLRLVPIVGLAWLLASLTSASAQAPAAKAQPKPYKAVAVTLPAALDDPSFVAFRQQLEKVAKSRVYSDLAQMVIRRGFFWDRDFGGGFDPNKSGVENLAVAVSLEGRGGVGWNTLAAFAVVASAARAPSRPGVVCSPAPPKFSEPDLDHLLGLTNTDGLDWLYAPAKVTPVRAEPNSASAVIDALGPHFVRVWREGHAIPPELSEAWERVLTPNGKIGFVERRMLASLEPGRLCYRKDITGRWHIAGYVGGGD